MDIIALYVNTIKYLKFEQLWYRVLKKIGARCPLIKNHTVILSMSDVNCIPAIEVLDYDKEFLERFDIDELLNNQITLLHQTEELNMNGTWIFKSKSPLWNHNLHYFEFLFALAKAYKEKGELRYLNKIKSYIVSWIDNNPIGSKNSSWECYPIALRITNWIDLYALLRREFDYDKDFENKFIESLFNQYVYLLNHLERHLLANHYFEDLKTLIIASVFFGDEIVCEVATNRLLEQCNEQIFVDGMHYERSPMYQKILLEDLIRVENSLEYIGKKNEKIRQYIKKMLVAAYSFENDMDRLPLFNDCGKNISKSLSALLKACKNLDIEATEKNTFFESGYYIYNFGNNNEWRMIVDAGQPGPDYSPGHAHCEMMSFELFYKGKPVVVNSGTFAYQTNQRRYFKSTEAHNTVKIRGIEQSEYWSNFRMARRARLKDIRVGTDSISMTIQDYRGNIISRVISIEIGYIEITDRTTNNIIESFLHFTDENLTKKMQIESGNRREFKVPYAEEFGSQTLIQAFCVTGLNETRYRIITQGES